MASRHYYHGSDTSGIQTLEARSKLHNSGEKVVYLTDSIPYALIYIWDKVHNGYHGKHVTGWIKDGITYYEEQFPNQLKTFYQGVSGTLYHVSDCSAIKPMENRPNLFFCPVDVSVAKEEYIADVFELLMEYERDGQFQVLRYTEQTKERQQELIEMVAVGIMRSGFYENDKEHQDFMRRNFSAAWERAAELKKEEKRNQV